MESDILETTKNDTNVLQEKITNENTTNMVVENKDEEPPSNSISTEIVEKTKNDQNIDQNIINVITQAVSDEFDKKVKKLGRKRKTRKDEIITLLDTHYEKPDFNISKLCKEYEISRTYFYDVMNEWKQKPVITQKLPSLETKMEQNADQSIQLQPIKKKTNYQEIDMRLSMLEKNLDGKLTILQGFPETFQKSLNKETDQGTNMIESFKNQLQTTIIESVKNELEPKLGKSMKEELQTKLIDYFKKEFNTLFELVTTQDQVTQNLFNKLSETNVLPRDVLYSNLIPKQQKNTNTNTNSDSASDTTISSATS